MTLRNAISTQSAGVPLHREAAVVEAAQPDRIGQRQRMRRAGLLDFRRHDPYLLGEGAGDRLQRDQAVGMDAVVIGDQDGQGRFSHRGR